MSFNSYSVLLARTGPAGLPAMVGKVPGRGTIATYALDDDGVELQQVGEVEAINVSSLPVGPDCWVILGAMTDWTRIVIEVL
jgi:hypothetical protein